MYLPPLYNLTTPTSSHALLHPDCMAGVMVRDGIQRSPFCEALKGMACAHNTRISLLLSA